MGRKSTIYDVYLNAVREKENKIYMDMLKSEKYTNFVKLMVDAAKEGKDSVAVDFDRDDNPDQIKEKWMFIKHIIKSFKYQFSYNISLYNGIYDIWTDNVNVKRYAKPETFYVSWGEHNKHIKQNIVGFIICLIALVGIWLLSFFYFETNPEPNLASFIIVCANIPITICSLGYSYKFGRELYYHYLGWYLILKGIERAGF